MTVRGKQVPRWLTIMGTVLAAAVAATTLGLITPGWATKQELVVVEDKADDALECCKEQMQESVENTREILRRLEAFGDK